MWLCVGIDSVPSPKPYKECGNGSLDYGEAIVCTIHSERTDQSSYFLRLQDLPLLSVVASFSLILQAKLYFTLNISFQRACNIFSCSKYFWHQNQNASVATAAPVMKPKDFQYPSLMFSH